MSCEVFIERRIYKLIDDWNKQQNDNHVEKLKPCNGDNIIFIQTWDVHVDPLYDKHAVYLKEKNQQQLAVNYNNCNLQEIGLS